MTIYHLLENVVAKFQFYKSTIMTLIYIICLKLNKAIVSILQKYDYDREWESRTKELDACFNSTKVRL